MKKFALLFGAALSLAVVSCHKHDDEKDWADGDLGTLEMEFDSRFGDDDLVLGTEYTTAHGETVKISKLQYFISNIVLHNEDGTEYVVPQNDSYFLIKEDKAGSNLLKISNIPAGNYDHVEFTVGVDSLRNTMDVSQRTGALDVGGDAAGMYWSWNSGYIFFKIEGESPSAPFDSTLNGNFWWYHIGGFGGMTSKTINNIRTLELELPHETGGGHDHDSVIKVRKDGDPHLHLFTDVSKIFGGTTAVKIAENPIVMFAPYSVEISKNFADVFKIDHIHQ